MKINALEDYCKPIYERAPSIIHRWGHIERTAIGAKWFIKVLGGTKEEEELAYIAGILHDIVRPNSEEIDHATASAEEAKRILKKFNFEEKKIPWVVQAVKDHRKPVEWASPLHQSVFLSDKLLEQMGAYIVFRRCLYAGELKDYAGMNAEEAIPRRFESGNKKTQRQFFPERFFKLYDYQEKWGKDFMAGFEKKEAWALNLGKHSFQAGREENKSFELAIFGFNPESEKEEKLKKEALDYINGKKFSEFEKMVLRG